MFLTNPQKGVIMKKSISILIFISAIAPLYGFYPGPLAKKKAALQEQVKTALAQKQIDKAQDLINQIQKETRDQALATTLQQELVAVKNQVEQARKAEDQRLLEQRKQAAQERGMIPVAQERKVAEERRLVPAAGQSEQQQRAELERKAAADRQKLEEARQKAEEARKAEEAKFMKEMEERRKAEEARQAAERQAKAAQSKKAEEALKKEEEEQKRHEEAVKRARVQLPNVPVATYSNLGVRNYAEPYEILGVSKNASQDDVTKAYRSLVRKWSRDTHRNEFELVQWAKENMSQ